MKSRAVLLAVVVSCLASTGAIAAGENNDHNHPTSREGWSDRCATLDAQFDALAVKYSTSPDFEAANGLHTDGISACAANDSSTGVTKLEEALRKLGVEPAS